jgi:hypothetical protein
VNSILTAALLIVIYIVGIQFAGSFGASLMNRWLDRREKRRAERQARATVVGAGFTKIDEETETCQ